MLRGLIKLINDLRSAFAGVSPTREADAPPGFDDFAPSYWYSAQLGQEGANEYDENRVQVWEFKDANLVGSKVDYFWYDDDDRHHVVLDIDHPMRIERSTNSATTGGGHLYVTLPRPVPWEKYEEFLAAAADIGLISKHYLRHSRIRRMTCVRRPGIVKPIRGGLMSGD